MTTERNIPVLYLVIPCYNEEAVLPEGASVPLQAVSTPAAEQAASPSRKLRREILAFFIRKPS